MIVCLEGPDKCGKSTLLEVLRSYLLSATFVPAKSVRGLPMQHAERLIAEFWRDMYDSSKLYVVDRSFTLTPTVYSRLHKRPLFVDRQLLRSEQLVFITLPPAEEWVRRGRDNHSITSVAQYEECVRLYREEAPSYDYYMLPWDRSVETVAREVRHVAMERLDRVSR